jgi:Amt family ammonium transporter
MVYDAATCAADGPRSVACIDSGDTSYMLLCTALVWFMTPGIAFFYGGLVREKNFLNTLYMNLAAIAVITVQYVWFGYSFAFSWYSKGFGDGAWVGLRDLGDGPNPDYAATIPHGIYSFYQLTFAMVTPAIMSGALVERMSFRAWLVFIFLWATIVYDPIAHWVWSGHSDASGSFTGGFLRDLGSQDFAGGTVVHMASGFSALTACIICGPRRNVDLRSPPDGHNVPMFVLGTVILWFGWFGFNGGSALAAGNISSLAMYNTQISAATAFATWMVIDAFTKRAVTVVGPLSGSIVGLVVITPCSGFVHLQSALAIGCISSLVAWPLVYLKARYLSGRWFMKFVDDSLDVFVCHGCGGMLGAFLLGWFGSSEANPAGADGVLFGGGKLLGWQVIAILMTIALSVVNTAAICLFIRFTIGIRYTRAEEDKGVDVVAHRQVAYRFEDDQIEDALVDGEDSQKDKTLLERVDEWNLLDVTVSAYNKAFGKKKKSKAAHNDTEMKDVNGDDDWERKKGKENEGEDDDRSQIVFGGRFGQASYAVAEQI